MDVTYKLQEIGILVTHYGFVTILEKVAMAFVAQVVCYGIACQKPPHKARQTMLTTSQEYMGMVGHQSPSIYGCLGFGRYLPQPGDKIPSVPPVINDPSPLYAPHYHMMQRTWRIKSGLSRHSPSASEQFNIINNVPSFYLFLLGGSMSLVGESVREREGEVNAGLLGMKYGHENSGMDR